MRLIDADELLEHVGRDRLDSRELISEMIKSAPTIRAMTAYDICPYCKYRNRNCQFGTSECRFAEEDDDDRQINKVENQMSKYGKKDCPNCIWHDTSCTKFYCQQITRRQIMIILSLLEVCEGVQADDKAGFMEKETAKVVAYEHIADILKGGQNDTKGS